MSETPPARRGRRNPALLAPDGDEGPQVELTADPNEEHAGHDDLQPEGTEFYLSDEGDIITVSFTLPVILEGHIKETYIGAKVTARVREDEDGPSASARSRAICLDSVLNGIDEAEDALRRYSEAQAERLARAGLPR